MSYILFALLIGFVCLLLILVIMVQNPKGGGLSSTFGGGGTQMLGGVQKTNDFLDRTTWTLACVIAVLVMLSTLALPERPDGTIKDDILDSKTKTEVPAAAPSAPAALPIEVPASDAPAETSAAE